MIIKKYYKNRVINKITDPEGAPGQYQSGQHYYHGRNAEQTPSPFSSMSNSSSRYTLSVLSFIILCPKKIRMYRKNSRFFC